MVPRALSIQPAELGVIEAGQALLPQQHMRRCPLVAPSQLEFMLDRKQFSVGVVEKEGVAELVGSEKKVWQVGCTFPNPTSTAARTAPTLKSRFCDGVWQEPPHVCVHDSPAAPSLHPAGATVVTPAAPKFIKWGKSQVENRMHDEVKARDCQDK